MFKFLFLMCSAFGFASTSHAHNGINHGSSVPMQSFAVGTIDPSLPQYMGASSMKLLYSDIAVTDGYGRGWYFEIPQNEAEELVNQGFAMYNMFQYTDAFRSFNSALNIDPNLVIASIGRGLVGLNLDPNVDFFLQVGFNQVIVNNGSMDSKTKAWSNMYLAMVTGKDLDSNSLSVRQAYDDLKAADPTNLEAYSLVNWIAQIHNMNDYNFVLNVDPNHQGALHYLMHLAEGESDHTGALSYGVRLVPNVLKSGHGQHMLGHVLPHFNRWNAADKQFAIAHQIHLDWASENKVLASEDWHYIHNLMLFSVTKMVIDPSNVDWILKEIENINPGAINDRLDYSSAQAAGDQVQALRQELTQIEGFSPEYKNYVRSSRLYFELVTGNTSDLAGVKQLESQLPTMPDFKNKTLLLVTTKLILAKEAGNQPELDRITAFMVKQLNDNFSRGGFDGWQKSVLDSIMFKKAFEVYGLNYSMNQLQTQIIDVYMNPID